MHRIVKEEKQELLVKLCCQKGNNLLTTLRGYRRLNDCKVEAHIKKDYA